MRRRLALLVLSVTVMVSIAYLLPLAVVVRVVARDRALSAADQESRTLAGVLAAVPDPAGIRPVLDQLNAGSERSSAVFLADGSRLGAPVELSDEELEVARRGRAFTSSSGGERRIIVPVRNPDSTVTVTVVAVPEHLLREGVVAAWVVIGAVGVVLVLLGVALADRLARSMIVASEDLRAVLSRDPACRGYSVPLLFFKGFHALQSYRVAHYYWHNGREAMALFLQSRISEVFAVDIHPGARIGKGIMFDHATSVVIGETAVVEDDFSMLHEVTLGGTGKVGGDRHPKIGKGVMIGAGAKVLGNIAVGEGARIGAGSVVLEDVPPFTTVAGVPARPVNYPVHGLPALELDGVEGLA